MNIIVEYLVPGFAMDNAHARGLRSGFRAPSFGLGSDVLYGKLKEHSSHWNMDTQTQAFHFAGCSKRTLPLRDGYLLEVD